MVSVQNEQNQKYIEQSEQLYYGIIMQIIVNNRLMDQLIRLIIELI
ncbi:unnamed protein product [Paramecium sonneborni]|uniref:Uncharacterized protein n=1 Tax=Paramecium sonneborni TaxID=65129 RepID=A0A8S1RDM8_9CILI|nr:unnamed protein product [Paramecium sonneborni]